MRSNGARCTGQRAAQAGERTARHFAGPGLGCGLGAAGRRAQSWARLFSRPGPCTVVDRLCTVATGQAKNEQKNIERFYLISEADLNEFQWFKISGKITPTCYFSRKQIRTRKASEKQIMNFSCFSFFSKYLFPGKLKMQIGSKEKQKSNFSLWVKFKKLSESFSVAKEIVYSPVNLNQCGI